MTTPSPLPDRTDPAHILSVCAAAVPSPDRDTIQLTLGRLGTYLYLPARPAARAARAALTQVGYRVDAAGVDRLIIRGWSTGALEARIIGMSAVLSLLAAQPGRTATAMLGQLRAVPAAQLAEAGTQRQLIAQAGQQLQGWLDTRSGIRAPHDPRFQPADAGDATRLRDAWRLEDATDDMAARQRRVAADALGLYAALRPDLGHAAARDTAVRQATVSFHLGNPARDTAVPVRDDGPAAGSASPLPGTRPGSEISHGPRPGSPAAREFPGTGRPVTPAAWPPVPGPDSPPGRDLRSGRSGRHP
jgi:hypothetical protein